MKILLVSPISPPNGGMATWTDLYLKDSENHNEVFTVNTAFIGERALHKGGKPHLFTEIIRFIRIILNYLKFLKNNEIDIIHINSSCSKTGIIRDAVCVAIAKKHHIVFHCHCNVQDQLKGKIATRLGKFIFNNVDAVLVLNKESQNYVNTMFDCKTILIPNAIDRNLIATNFVVSKNIKNIVYVGHVKTTKGICEIIEAANEDKNLNFHLVGPISDEISKISVPKNIIFYGRKEHFEAINIMKKGDVFLFPSYTEGFSMVMLEAMAIGLPIIASNVGANSEMIELNGGIIINPKSSEEIVDALKKISPSSTRLKMSSWNLNKVNNYYRDDMIFNKIQEVYNEICL